MLVSQVILNGRVKLDDYVVDARGEWFMKKKIGDKYRFNPLLGEESGVEIFPGIFQGTEAYNDRVIQLLSNIERDLRDHRSDSYTGLHNCGQDWTVGSFPLNLPLKSVGEYRKGLGLKEKADPEFLTHARDVFLFMRKFMSFSSVKIKKKSQSGAPLFVSGTDKAKLLYYSLNNVEKIVQCYLQKDLSGLIGLKALGIYAPNVRMQSSNLNYELDNGRIRFSAPDKLVVNPDFCLWQHGLIKNKPEATTPLDFSHPYPVRARGLLAARQRMIWSLNYIVNVYYQFVDSFIQSAMHKLELTHIESHVDMYNYFDGYKNFAAWDFASYDTTQGEDVVNVFFEVFIDGVFTEDFATMLRYLYRSPALLPMYKRGEQANLVLGDPFSLSLDGGMLSGIAIVASLGKCMAVAYYTYMMKKFTNDSIEDIIMGKQQDVRGKVFSDDKINGWKKPRWRDKWIEFVNGMKVKGLSYYDFKWESKPRFLGPIYGPTRPHLNLSKLIEGLCMVERSYRNKPAYFFGIADKLQQYSSEDEFDVIYYHIQKHLAAFNIDLSHIRAYQQVGDTSYTAEELEFLNNPDVIFYKYAPDYFPKDFVDAFFTTVPVSVFKEKLSQYVAREFIERFENE